MTDRPILFSPDMIRALLAGRKIETRRLIRNKRGNPTVWARLADAWERGDRQHRLWVREAFQRIGAGVVYRADAVVDGVRPVSDNEGPWHPSIHLPRALSRLTLIVTDVVRQRLHEIDAAAARREGAASGVAEFEAVWRRIHGANAWRNNPNVVAIRFDVEKRNIDQH